MERWRRLVETFWTADDEQLVGLGALYKDDPRFKANFDPIDPHLAEFVRDAIEVYVQKRRGG